MPWCVSGKDLKMMMDFLLMFVKRRTENGILLIWHLRNILLNGSTTKSKTKTKKRNKMEVKTVNAKLIESSYDSIKDANL